MEALQVNIVGTGNIAWHLVYMMQKAGISVSHIYGRDLTQAKFLAALCNANAAELENIYLQDQQALYFFAVADDAIRPVASKFNINNNILIHLSGAMESEILDFGNNRFGVYYPLQTFSKHVATDYSNIPVCIVSPFDDVQDMLVRIGKSISNQVNVIADKQKSYLHLAAVLVNNFTNHLYDNAFKLLDEVNLPHNYLIPLMEETVQKVKYGDPANMQTGPARRGDMHTIEKHLGMLEKYPELTALYIVLSNNIQKKYAGK